MIAGNNREAFAKKNLFYVNSPTSPDVTASMVGKYGWCKTDEQDDESYGFCSYSCTIPRNGVNDELLMLAKFTDHYSV